MIIKKIFILILCASALFSCQKGYYQEEEKVDPTLQNWEFSANFLGKNFGPLYSETNGEGNWVDNYDPKTGKNPVIGKTIEFHTTISDTTWSFTVWHPNAGGVSRLDCYYQLSSQHWNHPFGNSLNPIEITGMDEYRTKLNFCNGPQKAYCEFSFKEIE